MKFFLTFGQKYKTEVHPHFPKAHPDGWVEIEADEYDDARTLAFTHFGAAWAMLYEEVFFSAHLYSKGCLGKIDANTPLPEVGEAHARATDPETSHEAAAEVRVEAASRMEKRALDALAKAPNGLTNHELVEATGLPWNTISPRIKPLVRKGLVIDSGDRRKGPTNRNCIVWKKL